MLHRLLKDSYNNPQLIRKHDIEDDVESCLREIIVER